MRARAVVVAEAYEAGGTRFRCLRSSPPLSLRCAGGVVWMVGTAAGPLTGDRVELRVEVGTGASVTLRSTAATVVLGGSAADISELRVDVDIGAGAELRWLPEPTVATLGCSHRVCARIRLAVGARLLWREELVLGRHGEGPGRLISRTDVEVTGTPVLRQELRVGTGTPAWHGPAVLARSKAVGMVVVVDATEADQPHRLSLGTGVAVLPLAFGGGRLVTAVADDAPDLRSRLDEGLGRCLLATDDVASGIEAPR